MVSKYAGNTVTHFKYIYNTFQKKAKLQPYLKLYVLDKVGKSLCANHISSNISSKY